MWQKKRLEILNRDNFTCYDCGDTKTQLHVHHEDYLKNTEPWEYPNEYYTTLCSVCHKNLHSIKGELMKVLYENFRCSMRTYRLLNNTTAIHIRDDISNL